MSYFFHPFKFMKLINVATESMQFLILQYIILQIRNKL